MTATAFQADLARLNVELERLGAVITLPDGFVGIDVAKAPADLVLAYGQLVSHGYAAGYLPAAEEGVR